MDGERPEILPAGPLRQSAHLGVTESMVVELVAEPLPAVAAGDVGVALPLVDEVAVAVRLVAVFDLDARPVQKPREMSLQPAGDDLAEVDLPYAGCRLVQHAGGQPLLDAVGLDHLRRRPVPGASRSEGDIERGLRRASISSPPKSRAFHDPVSR